jgi:hypothetical protein
MRYQRIALNDRLLGEVGDYWSIAINKSVSRIDPFKR